MTYYRITEISEKWEAFDPAESIDIKRLPPGNYTVELNIPGFEEKNKQITTLFEFKVVPPFYQTAYFFILIGIFILIVGVSLIYYFRYRANKRQAALESIIVERTLELSENNIKLSKALSTRNDLITIFSHDIRGPLKFLGIVTDEISKKAHDHNYEEIYKDLNDLKQSSESTYTTADNLLNWIKSTITNSTASRVEFNLGEAIYSIINQNKPSLEKSEIEITTTFDKGVYTYFDLRAFNIVMQNIINNACKFAKSKLSILLSVDSDTACIKIQDDGGGVSDLLLKDLNKGAPVNGTPGKNGEPGAGLGLFMTTELIKRNDGEISFQNKGEGLYIEILLPLK